MTIFEPNAGKIKPAMQLKIISAGAGSGKTYRLTAEMVGLLRQGVRASGIIATTFTKKAAAELQERVRVKLLQEGLTQQAEDLAHALIGTVHSLGVKLLQRFAYEAGVSPEVSIIADEDQQILFNQSLSMVLTEERVIRMERLSDQLALNGNAHFDWRQEVRTLTEVARANDFQEEVLEASKNASFASFEELLGPANPGATPSAEALARILETTAERLESNDDSTLKTADVAKTLRQTLRELTLKGALTWRQWAQLGKLQPGAKSRDDMNALRELVLGHLQDPAFRQDIREFIAEIFDLAMEAIREYQEYKQKRGLIDYTDMEALVKRLLGNENVRSVLTDELDLLLVDEFQDTSPMQLDIFLKLSGLANYSIWVGDPKQSIYGFRGAAPELMQAIIDHNGGIRPEDIQGYSWRSREDLVAAANAVFTRAFAHMPKEQVALTPVRTLEKDPEELKTALQLWKFDLLPEELEQNSRPPGKPWMENCIAHTLSDWLSEGIYIQPKSGQAARKAVPGDVAVLCRTNSECMEMAEALHHAGLRAAMSRTGLMQTAEAKLLLACLKYLLHYSDSLSVAEILLLAEGQSIEAIIENRLEYLDLARRREASGRWGQQFSIIRELDRLRPGVAELSSAETLDLLLGELELRRIMASWGKPQQRLDNVEMLRQLALQYEDACHRMHSAASLGGFILWLNALEAGGKDFQSSGENAQAVNVLTYHRSKGLEWPIVVCHSLEKDLRADVWGISIVPDRPDIDLNQILGNRKVRYWVNPYGSQYQGTQLAERIASSTVYAQKKRHYLEEETRILYVGLTRARDYLIFPMGYKPTKWLNRTWHDGQEDIPALDPDQPESPWEWEGKPVPIQSRRFEFPRAFEPSTFEENPLDFISPPEGKKPHLPFNIDLKQEKWPLPNKPALGTGYPYLFPLVPQGGGDRQTGKAIKAFLHAFYPGYSAVEALEIAQRLTTSFKVETILDAGSLCQFASYWYGMVQQEFSPAAMYRKYPLHYYTEGRLFETTIDLLLDTPSGWVLIQHSGFFGEEKALPGKALDLASWCHLCRQGLQPLLQGRPIRTLIHFVLHQTMMEVLLDG